MSSICLAFDLYGTLLDTSSVSEQLSLCLPLSADAKAISAEWRRHLLEYTWRLNSMGVYENFDIVSQKSLTHVIEEAGYKLDQQSLEAVIGSYKVFGDVATTLEKLERIHNVTTLVFSNGTRKSVSNIIQSRPELECFANLDRPFVVADEIKVYKPATSVYHHLAKTVGKESNLEQVWVISSNPFDVVGARRAGMQAVWIDRKRQGWFDQLGEPTEIVYSMDQIVDMVISKM